MDLDRHKENVISFYRMAFHGNPREAVERYVGEKYIQHNPVVEDGKEGFINYFERMHAEFPEKVSSLCDALPKGVSGATFITTLAGRRTICYHGLFPSKRIR